MFNDELSAPMDQMDTDRHDPAGNLVTLHGLGFMNDAPTAVFQ